MWRAGLVALLSSGVVVAASTARATRAAAPTGASSSDSLTRAALARLSTLATTPGAGAVPAAAGPAPTCSPPPLPAPTFPNGTQGFGIPFRAALTGGELLSGYDLQWAEQGNYPWRSVIDHISGWVVGLLQVPSLSGTVAPSGIKFCDGPGDPLIQVAFIQSLDPRITPIQNYMPTCNGGPCPGYEPFVVSLAADPTQPVAATLNVDGVEANGALDLSGTTFAKTTVTYQPVGGTFEDCKGLATTEVSLGSKVQLEPAGGPPNVGLTFNPTPLTGPFPAAAAPGTPGASATLAGNGFSVPAFSLKNCSIGALFNQQLGGWNAKGKTNWTPGTPGRYASNPGWSQFTINATLTDLDLPVGVPIGFGFK